MNSTLVFLIIISILILCVWIAYIYGKSTGKAITQELINSHRADAIKRSRAVLTGHFSEQLAPYLPDFGFSPTECRFIGKPIDLIAFIGADAKQIDEVVFIEVKTGSSQLSLVERSLKQAIEQKRVRWVEYRPKG